MSDTSPCGSNDMIFTGKAHFRFSNLILSFYLQNKTELGCKECEELEEKVSKNFWRVLHILCKCSTLDCSWSSSTFLLLTNIFPWRRGNKAPPAFQMCCQNKFSWQDDAQDLGWDGIHNGKSWNIAVRSHCLPRTDLFCSFIFNLLLKLYISVA